MRDYTTFCRQVPVNDYERLRPYIDEQKLSGTHSLVSESVVKQIYIRNGDMVFAESSFEDDRLGEMLLREGKITVGQFNQASKQLVETGEKLGKILVEMSCMTPHELYQAVQR